MGGKSQPDEIVTTADTSGSTTGSSLSSQTVDIPKFLEPFIKQASGVGGDALSQLQQLLGGPLVAGFNQDQTQGFDLARSVAQDANGPLGTALETILGTARGDFLSGGQGFDAAVQAAVRAAQPGILSTFGAAGRRYGRHGWDGLLSSGKEAMSLECVP
ncbi:MAG: hypothetical protein VST64_04415 [Nitrospirota bacterium]|nr:hypothetical protein [Nitrospirota bacterium]